MNWRSLVALIPDTTTAGFIISSLDATTVAFEFTISVIKLTTL
jgi:hypothetical protein